MKNPLRLVLFALLGAGASSASSTALARTCAEVEMPDATEVDGARLVLNGVGVREFSFLGIDVFVAGLYTEARTRRSKEVVRTREPVQLRLQFVRDASRERLEGGMRDRFEKSGHQSGFERFIRLLPKEMSKGTVLELTFRPKSGLSVVVSGLARGQVDGEDFARALLDTFVGPDPVDEGLRDGLLGGSCG